MMKKRVKLSRKANKAVARSGAKTRQKNIQAPPMRGGYRL